MVLKNSDILHKLMVGQPEPDPRKKRRKKNPSNFIPTKELQLPTILKLSVLSKYGKGQILERIGAVLGADWSKKKKLSRLLHSANKEQYICRSKGRGSAPLQNLLCYK